MEIFSSPILDTNHLDLDFLHQQAQHILKQGADFCDLYLQSTLSESWSLDEGIIKSGSFAHNQGIGVRAICHEKSFLSYSNLLTPKAISELVKNLFFIPTRNNNSTMIHHNLNTLTHNLYSIDNSIITFSSKYKTDLLEQINQLARRLEFVTNVIASINIEFEEICIIRSDSRQHTDTRPLIHVSISIIINKNNIIEKGHSGFGGRYNLDAITTSILQMHITEAYNQAIAKTEAINTPSGQMPVILSNGWAGIILHEAVGHGLEGDCNRKQSSAFSNKIGCKVAAESVTVIDEGCIKNRRGSLNIDDEGNSTQKTVLIENGILKNYLFDELNARLMNTQSTGNGRRESFACNPIPRMTNTYMLGGQYSPEEIITSVKDGIYAQNFEGGQVDTTSGQFVFNASLAWVIKNGKIAYPVKGCALVGNGPEILKHVSMIGNDMSLDQGIGTCGKDGQQVPVGVGQPTIRIDGGLIVGGG